MPNETLNVVEPFHQEFFFITKSLCSYDLVNPLLMFAKPLKTLFG